MAAFFKQPAGKVKVFFISGRICEPDKRQFDFLMSRHPMAFPGTERLHHLVGETNGHIK